jgi:hypothetical protein
MLPPPEKLSVDRFAAALGARVVGRPAGAGRSRVVAVDGWSGSGKTSLADRLAPALDAPCVHLDDWVPGWHGLHRSVELLVDWVLRPLADGRPAGWRGWDWHRGEFGPWQSLAPAPGGLIVVEGCGAGSSLARPWLSELVWLSADADARARRLRARPDWALYEPWASIWAEQEQSLRNGDDPAVVAGVVVETGDGLSVDQDDPLVVRWRP